MRVSFLVRALVCGGAERQLVLLAKGMRRAGHQVAVHVFYPGGEFGEELKDSGIRVRVVGKSSRLDNLGFLLRAYKGLKEDRPSIVHSYMGNANVVTAILKFLIKPAKVVWGIRSAKASSMGDDWLFRATALAENHLASFPALIIANSEAGRIQSILRGFPSNKVVVVPNGVDLEYFKKDIAARSSVRKEWGFKDDDFIVGRIGRLDPVKDYPSFLRAAAIVAARDSRFKFVCVGPGPENYLSSLRSYSKELGIEKRVFWVGMTHEINATYNGLDLLASTSVSEGFPNVLLEAMACGVPCVTTDAGDARRIVEGTGLTVPHSDPKALADAFVIMGHSDKDSDRIRGHIAANYSTEFLVQRTVQHFDRLLTGITRSSI